ncbi:unnamed protein product [Calypogeia fissa]
MSIVRSLVIAMALVLVCAMSLQSVLVAADQFIDIDSYAVALAPAPAPEVGTNTAHASGLPIPPFSGILLMSFLSLWVIGKANSLFGNSK